MIIGIGCGAVVWIVVVKFVVLICIVRIGEGCDIVYVRVVDVGFISCAVVDVSFIVFVFEICIVGQDVLIGFTVCGVVLFCAGCIVGIVVVGVGLNVDFTVIVWIVIVIGLVGFIVFDGF